MSEPSLQLAKLMVPTPDVDSMIFETSNRSQYPSSVVDEIVALLNAGADPHLVVCQYFVNLKRFHRLLESDSTGDCFEGPYRELELSIETHFRSKLHTGTSIFDFNRVSYKTELTEYLRRIYTPLFDAAERGDLKLLKVFHDRGARINKIIERFSPSQFPMKLLHDLNPFKSAVWRDQYHVIEALLRLVDPGNSLIRRWLGEALTEALTEARPGIAQLLSKHELDHAYVKFPSSQGSDIVNFVIRRSVFPTERFSPGSRVLGAALSDGGDLCMSASEGDFKSWTDGIKGTTALIYSTGNASSVVCQSLLDIGADPNTYDLFGMTALTQAVYLGNEEAVGVLLAGGANPNHAINGQEYLHTILGGETAQLRIVWMTQRDMDAAMYEEKRWSAMHIAAQRGLTRIMQALLAAGACIGASDSDGCTPLDIAMRNSRDPASLYLLARRCPFDARSSAASRLLTTAAEQCNYRAVVQLAEAGVPLPDEIWYSDDYTEFRSSLHTEERMTAILSLEPRREDLSTVHGLHILHLCGDCSRVLETGDTKTESSNSTDSLCYLCRLQLDCALPELGCIMSLRHQNNDDVNHGELVTSSQSSIFLHPQDDSYDVSRPGPQYRSRSNSSSLTYRHPLRKIPGKCRSAFIHIQLYIVHCLQC